MRTRIALLRFFIGLLLVVWVGRLGYLQVIEGPALAAAADRIHSFVRKEQPLRASILARDGQPLALTIEANSIWANPREVKDPVQAAALLAPLLKLPVLTLQVQLADRNRAFVYLARQVEDATAQAVKALNLTGVHFLREPMRYYPDGKAAASVLGFTGADNQGLYGLELYYNKQLQGTPGRWTGDQDATARTLPYTVREIIKPKPGLVLQTTIDPALQFTAEQALAREIAASRAKAGHVIVMDPRTGEILALANWPTFDPNQWQQAAPTVWKDTAVTDTLSPGSVFKPVTAAAAIAEGLVQPDTPFVDDGKLVVSGRTIRNWNDLGLGPTTFAKAFEMSANTVFARVGLSLGTANFYRYLQAFGLLAPTEVDLPGEGAGIVPDAQHVRPIDLADMAFGQTLTVTPLQMVTAIAAIANGGELMWPHVAKAWLDQDGNVVQEVVPRVVRRVISPQTARTVAELMRKVVDEGTGKAASIPGYEIAGKTGTTQKVVDGRVSTDTFIASFMGFAPVENPRLIVYVTIDSPEGLHYGGEVAAPVFETVMREGLHRLGIAPRLAANQGPDLAQGARTEAVATPSQVQQAPRGGQVSVPKVLGLTMREAARVLQQAGFTPVLGGSGIATAQDPPAGQRATVGSVVKVVFSPPSAP